MEIPQKILVLGSTGMLGHQVVNYLDQFEDLDISNFSYKNKLNQKTIIVDAIDKVSLEKQIISIKPDFIINCIGLLIEGSKNIERAQYLNAALPNELKKISKKIDSKLIHISTDCVFSGEIGSYKENDIRDGKGTYAKTKILGEIIDKENLTIRTSIIGPELKSNGEGLFEWFMCQTNEVHGYKNALWSGVTTLELSKAIRWAIINNVNGLYHITNNKVINKCDLLNLFKKYTKKNIKIIPFENKRVDKSFVDTRCLIDYIIPSYDEMVASMIKEIRVNKSLYSRYNI
jgi:dTDP-4-dehydrorhamnose reductase